MGNKLLPALVWIVPGTTERQTASHMKDTVVMKRKEISVFFNCLKTYRKSTWGYTRLIYVAICYVYKKNIGYQQHKDRLSVYF